MEKYHYYHTLINHFQIAVSLVTIHLKSCLLNFGFQMPFSSFIRHDGRRRTFTFFPTGPQKNFKRWNIHL